jgi:hypothetical protein
VHLDCEEQIMQGGYWAELNVVGIGSGDAGMSPSDNPKLDVYWEVSAIPHHKQIK